MKNFRPDLIEEFKLRQSGLQYVAGIDEAGRGAWAGPVVAAAVILPLERMDLMYRLDKIRDSKMMSSSQRAQSANQIQQIALAIGIGEVGSDTVDQLGILAATRIAMADAVAASRLEPQHLLIDHILVPEIKIEQSAFPKGDMHILSIAAASIMAKVTRDSLMQRFGELHPGYGFQRHKGYGTKEHMAALHDRGTTEIHRQSFAPIKALN